MKFLIVIICSFFPLERKSLSVENWVVEKNSSLRIDGKTNISDFRCDIIEYLNRDTISLYKDEDLQKPVIIKGGLNININRFDCHQKHITADLKKTLKSDENPYMKIKLLSFDHIKPKPSNQKVKGYVEIQLAGVARKVQVDYVLVANQPGYLHLTGTKTMLFSDFKLIPPRKLAGLLRVEQEIKIQFQLMLRFVSVSSD